jgi:hypothetical protein
MSNAYFKSGKKEKKSSSQINKELCLIANGKDRNAKAYGG